MHRLEKLVEKIAPLKGSDVTRIREEADLSKTALGRIIGVTRKTVWLWESEPDQKIDQTPSLALLWVQSRTRR